jgi:hypothetical protein
MRTSKPTVRLRRRSLTANAMVATAAVIAISQLLGQVAHPQQSAPQAQSEQAQLFYSPWTKFCFKGQEPKAEEICFGGKDGRVEVWPGPPPTDPKVFAEQQRRLQQELARRAEEARKRLNQLLDESNR